MLSNTEPVIAVVGSRGQQQMAHRTIDHTARNTPAVEGSFLRPPANIRIQSHRRRQPSLCRAMGHPQELGGAE